jgi:hypothetical protein
MNGSSPITAMCLGLLLQLPAKGKLRAGEAERNTNLPAVNINLVVPPHRMVGSVTSKIPPRPRSLLFPVLFCLIPSPVKPAFCFVGSLAPQNHPKMQAPYTTADSASFSYQMDPRQPPLSFGDDPEAG